MSIEQILLNEPLAWAARLEGGAAASEAELVAIEGRKIETEAELKTANSANPIFSIFDKTLVQGYQCPRLISTSIDGRSPEDEYSHYCAAQIKRS